MSELDRRALKLVELLHGAPGDPGAWLRFLEALRDEISPDVVTLFGSQPHQTAPGILAGSGIGALQVQMGEFLRPSIRHPLGSDLPLGSVIQLEGDSRFQKTAVFQEVLAPAGVLPGPGFIVVVERTERLVISSVLVLPRTRRWKPRERDRALIARLAPHMVVARQVHLRLRERARDAEALVSAFDRLVLGVLFLDENARVSYANRSAAEMLGVAPGFGGSAALAAANPDERTRAWRDVLRSVQSEGENAFVYAHPADGRPLQVLSTPFSWPEGDGTSRARFARAVFVGDAKTRAGDPTGLLRELFGLTQGEARLALLLMSGCSVNEAARRLDVKAATARGVLKAIFAKTGTNRQANLVSLLLAGPLGGVRARAHGFAPRGSATGRERH